MPDLPQWFQDGLDEARESAYRPRNAQLFLPQWLVDRMEDEHRAFAEEMVRRQAGGGDPVWREHDGLWVVEVRNA